MATGKKTFDCVEMKNRIQAERLAEYESRKGEFASHPLPLRFFVVNAVLAWRE